MYCVNPNDDEPIFLIDCQIGRDDENPDERYIDGSLFARELLYMDGEGKKRIQVWINSPGGSVSDGMTMYHAMLATKTKVDTRNIGVAASIAGVLFQAGRKREMMDYATLMYHQAFNPDGSEGKGLDAINNALSIMISGRSWKDDQAVKKMMEKTSYINAQDALDSGLCDEVIQSDEMNKPRASSDARASWKQATEFVNRILPAKNQMDKKVICDKLGLDPNSSDEVVMTALNKQLAKETELSALKAKEKSDADALAASKAELDKLKNQIAQADKEKADAAAAAEKAKKVEAAKAKILETAKNRGLKLEDAAIDNYVNLAGKEGENVDAVIKAIEAIPVVKKAPVVNFNKNVKDQDKDAAFELDASGGVKSTEKMVAYMNNRVRNKAMNRFQAKEDE